MGYGIKSEYIIKSEVYLHETSNSKRLKNNAEISLGFSIQYPVMLSNRNIAYKKMDNKRKVFSHFISIFFMLSQPSERLQDAHLPF